MRRRVFLRQLATAPLALGAAGRLFAAPAGGAKLLVVFLRGGYDAANFLVPVSSTYYYESRPNLAVPRPGSGPRAAMQIDADWGLMPGVDGFEALFRAKEAALIPFAGIHDLSRSHFDTQDSIELGQPLNASRDFRSGFLNRLAAVLAGRGRGMSFTDQVPLVFRGDLQIPNMSLRNVTKPAVGERDAETIRQMYRGTPLEAAVIEGFAVRDDVQRGMAEEMHMSSRSGVTPRGFEAEARRIARLMMERYDVGFVDVGGWDTHIQQGGVGGTLNSRLAQVGAGLGAFASQMGERWRDTVVVVVSEFGRTMRENGAGGTDHGHGTVYWVLGGSVRGGRLAGEQVRVEPASLFENRDYPVLNEYSAVMSAIFARVYGLNASQLRTVFPGAEPRDLALI